MVTITYGHGFVHDCDSATGWTEVGAPTLAATALSVQHGDYLKLEGTAGAADQYTYWEYDLSNISSSVYTKYLVRWKTYSSSGLGARVSLVFTAGGPQFIVGESSPEFNTTFKVSSGTIASAKTIDKIRFYAQSDGACAGHYVHYDFTLLCKDLFTFPNISRLEFNPPPKYAIISIPRRVTDVTQNLGSESATVYMACDLNIGRLASTASTCTGDDWKRPQGVDAKYQTDYVKGEVVYDIAHNSVTEPFQWLDTGSEQFKVTLETPSFPRTAIGNKAERLLNLLFREYRLSDAGNSLETYVTRFGLDL